jgi:hypothetical protein
MLFVLKTGRLMPSSIGSMVDAHERFESFASTSCTLEERPSNQRLENEESKSSGGAHSVASAHAQHARRVVGTARLQIKARASAPVFQLKSD